MSKSLLTEQNTRKVERLVRRAAAAHFGRGKARRYFEHGQWWVIVDIPDGDDEGYAATYSVVDSYPSVADTGLAFEEV